MEVFRLSRKQHAKTLSGKGASIHGARWNSIGVDMVYTASNRSLAMAEVLVHISMALLPTDFIMVTIHVPDDIASKKIAVNDLPAGWNAFPHIAATQAIGDTFIAENKYGILSVPSAVTQGDYNVLINPHHKDFTKIKILQLDKFPFDKRIFKC